MNIFITGAAGFVGTNLIKQLLQENVKITAAVLAGETAEYLPAAVEMITVEPLSEFSDYTTILQKVDIVIHLAARVHIMKETATDALQEFRKVNLHGTERLARQSAKAGVKRFVFMSTIGVNGDNACDKSYTEQSDPHPHNAYSVSKFEAELVLKEISNQTGMEVIIIRAPLVYGPGNPGNFLSLLRILSNGVPLPLSSVNNRRSLIYVGNLADAIALCATHPAALGNTYLVSDGDDVSTPELIRRTSLALGLKPRLFPFPVALMRIVGQLTGKTSSINRLTASLTVDSSKIRHELGWKPPFTMEEGLIETAKWFMQYLEGKR